MSRNGTGTYTLPQPAFTPGTTISSAAVNSDLSDIASALTQSFSADGQTPMSGQFKGLTGSVSTPGFAFANGVNTGLFLNGAGSLGITSGGTLTGTTASDGSITWNGASTFTGNMTINSATITFSSGAKTAFWAGLAPAVAITMVIDGAGSTITTGVKGYIQIPFAMTITSWTVTADQSGSISVDIIRANAAIPSSSIVGAGNKPGLSSAQGAFNTAPSSWTSTAIVSNDVLGFNVGSATSVQRVTVQLIGPRTSST